MSSTPPSAPPTTRITSEDLAALKLGHERIARLRAELQTLQQQQVNLQLQAAAKQDEITRAAHAQKQWNEAFDARYSMGKGDQVDLATGEIVKGMVEGDAPAKPARRAARGDAKKPARRSR